ncbi:MAG TPA: SDR family NAD(P)-dependent oxidoreductase [Acidimicrobiales bacterium]
MTGTADALGARSGSPSGRLAGRTAIVTGASRGIGKAIATAFGSEGAAVAVVSRTESVWDPRLPGTIHETVEQIVQAGGRAVAVAADLADPRSVEGVLEVVHGALGPVDLLVNNAALTVPGRPPPPGAPRPGIATPASAAVGTDVGSGIAAPPTAAAPADPGSFLAFSLKGFRRHFEVGVFAAYRLMQMVLPDMMDLGRGAIVNVTSVASSVPGEGPYERSGGPTAFAYGGNKAALEHLTRAVAFEMAPHGIAVNALSPSSPVITPGNLVAAPGTVHWASPEGFAEAAVRLALATPDTMTGTVAWSDDLLHPELGRRGWLGDVPS